MARLERLTINGFKSIRELSNFKLRNLNVLVGANGSGKSNFISFFRMLRAFMNGSLSAFVEKSGGMNDVLFLGRKITPNMSFEMYFGERAYRFSLSATDKDDCMVESEARWYYHPQPNGRWWELPRSPNAQSSLVKELQEETWDATCSRPVYDAITSWQIYHLHDTSTSAGMRRYEILEDHERLREDASNIAPFLLKLRENSRVEYNAVIETIRLVLPFFDDFILAPQKRGEKSVVSLSWRQRGSDYPMQPYHLSDGSIRFICLAVALLQPRPPAMIILDEPELGLHPSAISVLAELIQSVSARTQIFVATQSPALVDNFSVEDIVVASRKSGESTFHRLTESDFKEWLNDYSLGELWVKNVIAGGPSYE